MNDALGLPQSILVLGGGSDIARAIVRALLAQRAADVILGGRPGSPALASAEEEARQLGAPAVHRVDFDATDPSTLATAVDAAFDRHGDIDLAIVAFGVLGREEDDLEVATVNYTASVVAGQALARRLREQGHGTLLALSSVAGVRVRRANFVYGSSKAGMDGFFQGLGDALAGTGPRVVIVRPGFVHSRMTRGMPPAPFATDPDAVARAVVAGLATQRDVIWVPPTLRLAFTVFRLLPQRIWRKMPN